MCLLLCLFRGRSPETRASSNATLIVDFPPLILTCDGFVGLQLRLEAITKGVNETLATLAFNDLEALVDLWQATFGSRGPTEEYELIVEFGVD